MCRIVYACSARGGGNLKLAPQGFRGGSYLENGHPKKSIQFLKIKSGSLCQKFCNNRFGFTLAEVLITLGIIGVVAAMTMPTLINRTKNKEIQAQFKKTYSELNQMSQLFMNDMGMSVTDYCKDKGATLFVKQEFPKYFKDIHVIDDTIYNSTDEDGNLKSSVYQVYSLNGAKLRMGPCDNFGFRSDSGGRIYSFNSDTIYPEQQGPVVCVDVNGQKKPNKYGYDIFIFRFVDNGLVLPMGKQYKSDELDYGYGTDANSTNFFKQSECKFSSKVNNQISCAAYALADQHPTEQGKNYWQDFLGGSR